MENNGKTVYDPTDTSKNGSGTAYDGPITAAALKDAGAHSGEILSNDKLKKGTLLLGTYRVESAPIHGGMGSVWRVHHKSWDFDLAMKRPKAKEFRGEAQKAGFIRECESWINLGLHPNIVSCYYVREIGGAPTIFSEWMENGSLKDRIRDGSVYAGTEAERQERLLDIAIQFARGLRYAHKTGLIHQDVKPHNLLLTKRWDAKVSDFGLSQAMARLTAFDDGAEANIPADPGATLFTPYGGSTPAYRSPEQAAREPLTRRTDIYSWAVSMLELYLGERPWGYGEVAGLGCEEYFPECRVPMPEALRELLAQCLEMEPEDRPHDFAAVETELLEIYRGVTGDAYPRPEPKAAADTAGSLNNRALSFLDLGKPEEADRLWEQASECPEAVFNRALSRWRRGLIGYDEAREQLAAIQDEKEREAYAMCLSQEMEGCLELPESPHPKLDLYPIRYSGDGKLRCGMMEDPEGRRNRCVVCTVPEDEILFSWEHKDAQSIMLSWDGRSVFVHYRILKDNWQDFLAVFALPSGLLLREVPIPILFHNEADAFSPDGKWMIANVFREPPKLYDLRHGTQVHLPHEWELRCCTSEGKLIFLNGDGDLAVGCLADGTGTGLYGPESLSAENLFSNITVIPGFRGKSNYIHTDMDPGFRLGKNFILICGADASWLVDIRSGQVSASLRLPKQSYGHEDVLEYTTSYPNGAAVLTGDSGSGFLVLFVRGRVRGENGPKWGMIATVWEPSSGRLLQTLVLNRLNSSEFFESDEYLSCLSAASGSISYVPGRPSAYRLSRVESLRDRMMLQKGFDYVMRGAEAVFGAGDISLALSFVDRAMEISGFQFSPAALRARARFAQGLEKTGLRRVVPLKETAPAPACRRPLPESPLPKHLAGALLQLKKELLTHTWGDVYSEFSASVEPVEYSLDGRLLLVTTLLHETRDSPVQIDIEVTDAHGAAVLDAATGAKVFFRYNLYYKDPYAAECRHHAVLSHDGSRLLFSCENLSIIPVSGKGEDVCLAKGEFLYADFLDNDRYVLCHDTQGTVHIIDTVSNQTAAACSFSRTEFEGIRHVNDDCFAITHSGTDQLCWLDWEYALPMPRVKK